MKKKIEKIDQLPETIDERRGLLEELYALRMQVYNCKRAIYYIDCLANKFYQNGSCWLLDGMNRAKFVLERAFDKTIVYDNYMTLICFPTYFDNPEFNPESIRVVLISKKKTSARIVSDRKGLQLIRQGTILSKNPENHVVVTRMDEFSFDVKGQFKDIEDGDNLIITGNSETKNKPPQNRHSRGKVI